MAQNEHDDIVIKAAENFRIDANLIRAIMMTESSGGECYKPRYEPQIPDARLWSPREFSDKLGISFVTEQTLQRMSWGPLQILGSTARWMGFELDLPMLCTPDAGIFYACKYLRWLADRCDTEDHIIASYNGGLGIGKTPGGQWVNMIYVDRVYSFLNSFRKIN